MKKMISLVVAMLVFLSSCAGSTYTVNNTVEATPTVINNDEKPGSMLDATYNAIQNVCKDASNRIEVDRNEEAQKLCRERIIIFFRSYPQKIWMSLPFIQDVALGVVYRWSEARIKTNVDAYGCSSRGCTIVFDQFPAGRILIVIKEEMIKQGKILYEQHYIVPPLD